MEYRQGPSISISFLILSILVLVLSTFGSSPDSPEVIVMNSYVPFEFRAMSGLEASDFKTAFEDSARSDHIVAFFQNPDTRPLTLAFFEKLTGDYGIASAILEACAERDVPPALAFALAYEESGFDPKAFNRNPSSIDRGVFQLNSSSFPDLSITDFYDVGTNVRLGVAHLAFCLKQGGNDVAALAVYNAGLGRVSKGGTPRRTLDYIYKITGNRERLEALFEAQVVARHSDSASLAQAQADSFGAN
ncbi:MAG: lytic transglycosylase domain-containing protein [Spirochaetes bacterium]|nr:lytic transglycosylase domain-containing protein [Spirochaetota bacterium]MBU1080067.1 lytic transglycosylase domain-containing protein [Spirochaetota bacterium]